MTLYRDEGYGWFRLWRGGPGLSWTREKPLFSERNGYRKPICRFGAWRVFWIEPV